MKTSDVYYWLVAVPPGVTFDGVHYDMRVTYARYSSKSAFLGFHAPIAGFESRLAAYRFARRNIPLDIRPLLP